MPYKSRKVRNKNCYKVYKNDKTKKVFAKCATKENAQRQMRLLRAIQNNKNFKPNARRNMGGKSRKNKTLKIKGGVTNRPAGHNIGFEQPAYPLQVNDYIRLSYGNFVYIFVIDGNSLRTQQHSLSRAITGVIISALGTNEDGFYHMIVTEISGNSDSDRIQVGTVLLLPMLLYNSTSHPRITPGEQGSEETKTGDSDSDSDDGTAVA